MKKIQFSALCGALSLTLSGAVHAQAAPPAISLDLAIAGARQALAACADVHFGGGASVAVLDANAATLVILRPATAPKVDPEVSRRKAYTALKTGMTSREFGKSVGYGPGKQTGPQPVRTGPDPNFDPLKLPVWRGDPDLVPYGGGFLIKVNGQVAGAIGLSGAPPNDEKCAKAGQAYIQDHLLSGAGN